MIDVEIEVARIQFLLYRIWRTPVNSESLEGACQQLHVETLVLSVMQPEGERTTCLLAMALFATVVPQPRMQWMIQRCSLFAMIVLTDYKLAS